MSTKRAVEPPSPLTAPRNAPMSTDGRHATGRLVVVDALRGLAVVFMIAMHTGDGWLAPVLKDGATWSAIRLFGGMAAPLFLLLAGVSLGIVWSASPAAPRDQLATGVSRGLQLVVLGYALRVQMWMLDGGGYRNAAAWTIAATLILGHVLLYRGLARWRAGGAGSLLQCGLGIGAATLGTVAMAVMMPDRLPGALRVDVLQAIGASVVLASLVGAVAGARMRALAAIGVLIACATPLMQSWVPGPLPEALAGYLARWAPAPGARPAGMFPMFPWTAYTFLGAAIGLEWARHARDGVLTSRLVAMSAFGAVLALLTYEAVPQVSALLQSHPWLVQPVRVGHRVGFALVLVIPCLLALKNAAARWVLVTLGRASLLVYWVHLEFAFGIAARPFSHALDAANWLAGTLLLTALMCALAWLWERLRQARRSQPITALDAVRS